jgi:hypothetical protein
MLGILEGEPMKRVVLLFMLTGWCHAQQVIGSPGDAISIRGEMLPSHDAAGVLTNDGNGHLSWGPQGTGTINGVTAGTNLSGGGTAGNVTLNATTQRGKSAKIDLGLDNTGATDIGPALNAYCATYGSSNTMPELFFPAGTYLISTPVLCAGTNSTLNNLAWIGEGRSGYGNSGSVTFNCNTPGQTCFWFKNTSAANANNKGPRLEHLTFLDTSASNDDFAQVRITQFNNIRLRDVAFNQSKGDYYSTGAITVTNGSTTVTGSGTSWTSAMAFGHLWVNGHFQEVNSVLSATSLTLTIPWQYPTASATAYSLDYGGVGLMLEGTSTTGFTQYGAVRDLMAYGDRIGVDAVGGPTSASGTSRIGFDGGYINCNRVPDSMAFFFGEFSDTMDWNVAENNCAFFGQIESGHAHKIRGLAENTGAYAVVTTCNGGTASQACTKGVDINSDNAAHSHDNELNGAYIYNVGTAFEIDSTNVTDAFVLGNRFRSNANNYQWADGTTGCSASIPANVKVWQQDCSH